MIRARIGQAALRAYPAAARQARGLEMLGMLLDAGEHSRLAFLRESGSLVLGGLRERRTIATRAGTRRLVADSCCQAVVIWLTLWIISAVNTAAIDGGPRSPLLVQEVVLAAILACALIGHERIAAVSGLAAFAAFGPLGPDTQLASLVKVLVPVGCLLVMASAPRTRPRDPRRPLWLLPVFVLAALQVPVYVSLAAVLALTSLAGLLRLLHDPRLAIACTLVWLMLLTANAGRPAPAGLGLLMILAAAAGVMFAVAAGRRWIIRHSATG